MNELMAAPQMDLPGQAQIAMQPTGRPVVECFDPEANLGEMDIKPDRFMRYRSKEERRELVCQKVMDKFRQYKDHPMRTRAVERWNLEYRLIMRWKETTNPDEIVLGEIWRERETMITQFKGLEKFVGQYKARVPGAEHMAKAATAIVRDQVQRYGSIAEGRLAIENMVDHGVGYLTPIWSRFKRVATKIDNYFAGDGTGERWDKETSEVIENGPQLKHINPFNIFVNPHVREAKDSDAVFVTEGMSDSAIKTMVHSDYYDSGAAEECINAGMNEYRDTDNGNSSNSGDDFVVGVEDRLHLIVTMWANGYEFVVGDGDHLLRVAKLPEGKIPVITLGLYQMDGEHYGEGLPSKLASLQRVVNQLATWKQQQTGFAANPVLLLKNGTTAERDFKRLKLKPGDTLGVNNMEDAKYLEFPREVVELLESTIGFYQNAQKNETGINDRFSGQGENTGTATLGMSLIKAATDRIQYKVDCLVPQFQECFQWMYNLNARHLDHTYTARVDGKDGVEYLEHYPPTVFAPDVDQEVVLGSPSGPEQVNMWGTVLKFLTGMPGLDLLPVADKLLLAGGMTDAEVAATHVSGPNAQGDALAEVKQWVETGLMPEAKPSDNHQIHVELKTLVMQSPQFMAAPPQWQQSFKGNVATHMAFLQQQQQAMAAQSQMALVERGKGDGPGGGESAANKKGNDKANGMFNMGERGAQQLGAA